MQINITLHRDSAEEAAILRRAWFPTSSAQQTRDAFIYNESIDRYQNDPVDLLPIIENEKGDVVQRKVTIKSSSYDRLKTISEAIEKPISTTYRAIISYQIQNIDNLDRNENVAEPIGTMQLLSEKIAKLEKQLEGCNQTLAEMKNLFDI